MPDYGKKRNSMMQVKEWTKISHNARLDVEILHARFVQHAYPRHSHDYYVISLIERGRQSFTHKGTKYTTPPGGVILINPDEVHTGEAADGQGFELRSIYPTISHMEIAIYELTGHVGKPPFFADVRVDHPWTARNIIALHKAIEEGGESMECESRFIHTLTQLIKRYADTSSTEQKLGNEKTAIQKARQYIDEHFAQGVSLNDLAQYVALSPYYLLRAFCAEVGMPPYAYLESTRIHHTQRLIETGKPLAEIAANVGFSSQSHMTRSFKKIIGVTPGQYAQQIRA
jgi:AraC-like DNA-binding protein